jgi:hypothetical protein
LVVVWSQNQPSPWSPCCCRLFLFDANADGCCCRLLAVQDSAQIDRVMSIIVGVAGRLGEGARTTFDAWKVFSAKGMNYLDSRRNDSFTLHFLCDGTVEKNNSRQRLL